MSAPRHKKRSPRPLHERETGGLTPAKTRLVLVGVHLEVSYVEPARVPARVDDLDAVADLPKSGVARDKPLRHQVVGELLDIDRAGLGLVLGHVGHDAPLLLDPQVPLATIDRDRLDLATRRPLTLVLGPDHQLGDTIIVTDAVDPDVVRPVPGTDVARTIVPPLGRNALVLRQLGHLAVRPVDPVFV